MVTYLINWFLRFSQTLHLPAALHRTTCLFAYRERTVLRCLMTLLLCLFYFLPSTLQPFTHRRLWAPLLSVTPLTASEAFSLDRILKDNSCYFPPLHYSFVYSREKMHFSCFVLLSSFSSFCSLLLFLWICSDKPTTDIPTIMLHKTQLRMEAIGMCTPRYQVQVP